MTHKYRKGDKVFVFIDLFGGYVPAEVTSVSRNLVNLRTQKGQTFTTDESNLRPLKLAPRPRREVVRFVGFGRERE